MTTTASPPDAAVAACRAWDLPDDVVPLHAHATSVFLVPRADAVVRVSGADQHTSLARSVTLARWLSEHGLPVTTPLDVPQPFAAGDYAVTVWWHLPQHERPTPHPEHLGRLLRRLHALPQPPIDLPAYQPHETLRPQIPRSAALRAADRHWLLARSDALLAAYDRLDFPLGHGLIHGDAYPGNTLWNGNDVVLGDWDEAAFGPRELDLANTFQGIRFGRSDADLHAFSLAYGHDLTHWPGLPVLTELRDLHTLGSFIRRADHGDAEAARQLAFRLGTLRAKDRTALWRVA
ncbi:hypothetical protein GCM10028784_39430 [Myceligenerans cantabricum]